MKTSLVAGSDVVVTASRSEDRDAWDAYVRRHPDGTAYHLGGWADVIGQCFGHRTVYLVARYGEAIAGLLPLVFMESRLFGRWLVSMPFLDYGGVLADDAFVESALVERAVEIARDLGADHLELRHATKKDLGLVARHHKVSMRLDLPAEPSTLWEGFSPKLRNQIRRPQKDGCTARVGGAEELDAFYAVFAENMRDLGTPVYPRRFFAQILERFPALARIVVVTRGSIPVAGGFLIGFNDHLHAQWASSLRRYNRMSPNMLLYWSILEEACRQKYERFDFGRSTPGSGTYRFKEQWGAQPLALSWDYWLREGEAVPELNHDNPRFALAIKLWQRLPLVVANRLGPWIIRHVPA